MLGYTEFRGESDYDRRHRGSIEFEGEYVARRKPAWLVLGKLAVIFFVVGFAYILALRHIDYPTLPLTAVFFGIVLIYCGVAYVVRPRPNDVNMGWAGGLMNDPTQYSDNINRGLRDLECVLQPGQLATEAVLDLLILFGWHRAYEPSPQEEEDYDYLNTSAMPPAESSTTGRVLPPDRFDRP